MKITDVQTAIHEVDLREPISWATGGLSRVGECYVRVTTEESVVGLGFSYPHRETVEIIEQRLTPLLIGADPFDTERIWMKMHAAVHTIGQDAVAMNAISAIDIALWDIKARFCGLPLYRLIGASRSSLPVYGSGGFVSYSIDQLEAEMAGYVERGIRAVKMKIGINGGQDPKLDLERVAAVRGTVGDEVAVFVDANGAYRAKQAIGVARELECLGVGWFEEPVHASDMSGLAKVADATTIPIATGEFEYTLMAFRHLMAMGAVDIVQADAGRVGGVTAWLKIAHLAESFNLPVAPHAFDLLHLQLGCAVPNSMVLEHLGIYADLPYASAPEIVDGCMTPDPTRPGHGVELDDRTLARLGWPALEAVA